MKLPPDVDRPDAVGHPSGGQASQERQTARDPEQRRRGLPGDSAIEDWRQNSILKLGDVQLGDAGGPISPSLNRRQIARRYRTGQERPRENVRRGDGVLNSVVDPIATHWRHDVGGVADEQQAGAIPAR